MSKKSAPQKSYVKLLFLALFPILLALGVYYYFFKRPTSEVPARKNVISEAESQKIKASLTSNNENLSTSPAAKILKSNSLDPLSAILLKPKSDSEREQFISQTLHFISVMDENDKTMIKNSTWQRLFNLILPIMDSSQKSNSGYPPKTKVLASRLISQIPLPEKDSKDELILKMAQNPKQDSDIRFILLEGLLKKNPTQKNVIAYFKKIIRIPRPMDSAALAQILGQMYDQKEKEKILIDFLDYFPKIPENSRLYWLANYTSIKTTPQQDRRILNAFPVVTSDMTREALIEFIKLKQIRTAQSNKILGTIKKETKNPALVRNAEVLLSN